DRGGWQVLALLTFYNPTDQPIQMQVGFPVTLLGEGYDEFVVRPPGESNASVGKFEVSVNGKPTTTSAIKGEEVTAGVYMQAWDSLYVFEVEFAPRRHTDIRHSYTVGASVSSMGESWLPYVFRTGAGWAGNIEEAVFEYRLSPSNNRCYLSLLYGEPFDGSGAALVGGGQGRTNKVEGLDYDIWYSAGPQRRLIVTFRNIEPQQNLTLYSRHARGELELEGLLQAQQQGRNCGECLQRFALDLTIDDELLACYEPQLLINLLYARRGYHFSDEKMQELFYGSGFYLPSDEPFDRSWLSPEEQQAIKRLRNRLGGEPQAEAR
ncbi:MAG: YARHG domain-containing protein, partial [Candidatus Alcyoniella australis]|nr:YARHG domain-containing protein [Candidatus Alcyoniella australis]